MQIRGGRYRQEKQIEAVFAYILVGLDKLRKVWYRMQEVHNERMYHEVRLLVDVEVSGFYTLSKGDTVQALVPTNSEGHPGVCYLQYSGTMLYATEYEFVIADEEYAKLLEG